VSNTRFDVRAFDAEERDPGLGGAPLASRRLPTGEWEVLINTRDRLFRSATMTPLDALLGELAWRVVDFTRGQQNSPTHAVVLASLRGRYARAHELDPVTLGAEARQTMTSIARAIAGNVTGQDARALFDELSTPEREAIQARMAARDVRNRDAVIGEGRFLEFASSTTIRRFVAEHPELFFDGRYWDDAYEDTGFDLPHVIAEARGRLVSYYTGLISDAAWLADQEPADLEDASRERLLRASLALQLLEPTGRESREVAV
jgi:hypothetical protein